MGEPGAENNLVLVLASCTFLSGPVAWNPQRLSVHVNHAQSDGPHTSVFELRDDAVNFIARANMFTFKRAWNLLELGSVMFPHSWRSSDA